MTNLTTEEMQRIVDGAPEWDCCHNVKTGNYVAYPEHRNLNDLRTILAQQQEIERLREQLDIQTKRGDMASGAIDTALEVKGESDE